MNKNETLERNLVPLIDINYCNQSIVYMQMYKYITVIGMSEELFRCGAFEDYCLLTLNTIPP